LPNTLLAPHLGYATGEYLRRSYAGQVESIRTFLEGGSLIYFNPAALAHAR
jgi:phosphoglycerate dehydrogenase-like enzyme